MENLLVRASGAYKLMGKSKRSLTDLQRTKLSELRAKEKLTATQEKELEKLSEKEKFDGELSATAKTLALEMYAQNEHGRRKMLTTDALKKGIMMEDDSFNMIQELTGLLLIKNTERIANDHFIGEIDSAAFNEEGEKVVIDVKNKEDLITYLKLLNKDQGEEDEDNVDDVYFAQMQVYMDLHNADEARIFHTLQSAPQEMLLQFIQRDIYSVIKYLNPFIYKNSNAGSTTDWSISLLDVMHLSKDEILEIMYSQNYLTQDLSIDEEIVKVAKQTYLNNHFDNILFGYIQPENRMFVETVNRNQEYIDKMKSKVVDLRKYYKTIKFPSILEKK